MLSFLVLASLWLPAGCARAQNLVIVRHLQGPSGLDEIALRLIGGGRATTTPLAVISSASLPGRAVLRRTLGACTPGARRAPLPSPALVVAGEVVALSLKMPDPDHPRVNAAGHQRHA